MVGSPSKMSARFQLEDFSLLKLSVAYKRARKDAKPVEATQHSLSFDFDIDVHAEEKHRYRMLFRMAYADLSEDQEPAGYDVEADIVGFLRVDEEMPDEEKDKLVPANGVSVLYGVLRGVVGASTGAFAGGKLVLPTMMPHDIVKTVLSAKNSDAEKEESLAERI